MSTDKLTVAVTCSMIAVLIVFDVWTIIKRGYGTTISWNLRYLTVRYPVIALAIGIVLGHLFWPHSDCVQP